MEEFFNFEAPGRVFLFPGSFFVCGFTEFIRYKPREVKPWSSKTRSVPAVRPSSGVTKQFSRSKVPSFGAQSIIFLIMNTFDFRPRFSPIIDNIPYHFSIGVYRGRKRVVIAWFIDELAAHDYLIRCRLDHPKIKFDCLQSLM